MVKPVSFSHHLESGDAPQPDVFRDPEPSKFVTGRRLFSRSYTQTPDPKLTTTTSERGEMRTINHLPDEMILAIFDFATSSTSRSYPGRRDFGQIVLLTHVSHRWREVLLSCGRMWSDICISGQNIDALDTQINRCGGAPLFVAIRKPFGFHRASRSLELMDNTKRAANLIRKSRNQVTGLKVHLDCRNFRHWLGFEWPNLERFEWVDSCSISSNLHGDSCDERSPRLRYLSISGGFNWPMISVERLTTLKLIGPMELEPGIFAQILRRNTTLESLGLNNLDLRGPLNHLQEKSIKLPHLKELSLCYVTSGCTMALLDLPSLNRLEVSSSAGQRFWLDSPWPEFCSRLSITNLNAQYSGTKGGVIRVVGSNGLDVEPLCFKDFSYTTMGATLFQSFSNTSLSSVTSFSFIKNMPEEVMTRSQISAICDLLKHLSRVECMWICPSPLAIAVVQRLGCDSELCPRLEELGLTLTNNILKWAEGIVDEMLETRTGRDEEWEKKKFEYPCPAGLGCLVQPKTRVEWKKAKSIGKYASDE